MELLEVKIEIGSFCLNPLISRGQWNILQTSTIRSLDSSQSPDKSGAMEQIDGKSLRADFASQSPDKSGAMEQKIIKKEKFMRVSIP